jgi:hypothetical protein
MAHGKEAAMLLFALAGCDIIDLVTNVQETVDDLTNPVIIQATFIGVGDAPEGFEFPEDSNIGPLVTALLADTEASSDLAEAPVEGATASIKIGSNGAVTLSEASEEGDPPGYSAGAEEGLTYEVGQSALLKIETETIKASATWIMPDGLDFDVPCRLSSQQDLTIVMDSTDYHSPLVTVIDQDGTITWTNLPADIDAAVDWVISGGFSSVAIPGADAFAADGPYIIGIAPVQRALPEAFEGVNISLSAYMVGQMRFWSTYAGEVVFEVPDSAEPVADSGLPDIGDTACLDPEDFE